ncbi:MAG: NAD-dependent epimerase/dehydratase family protein [Candidatus Hydrogenedens sp.]|nr:NAD-dependent epimerase/dehydratase family protein [Candidatus Hydrogenedentota bacterium]NLF57523.1 NAD-dependent epimerase/dehydratase family protein [Candidatus Hydrogenedens sp.]
MRVLVIGGTGLISTAIVNRLLDCGHEPVLFNRGTTSPRLRGEARVIKGDRGDNTAFAEKVRGVNADAVIDMITYDAGRARHAVEVFSGKTGQYLFCSTVCVYGGPLDSIPATEDEPHKPVSEYGRGKSAAEAVFMAAFGKDGFPVTIFRPSHCYGPGQPLLDIWGYNPCLVSRIREGRPIIVPGDGRGLWQPGHVDDVAKGFVGALGRPATLGRAYNVVGDEIMNWRNFHKRMARALGREANIVPMTTRQIAAGAPKDQTQMLRENFQYNAAYSNAALKADVPEFTDLKPWEDGVRETVQWMDENGIHRPCGAQPWIDRLAEREAAFLETLAGGEETWTPRKA